jgi:histidyl-tRNA synthetase
LTRLRSVRGTHDILPDEMRRHRHVIDVARTTAALYGYHEMATPIFEFTEVFARPLGETSDIVTKEMYTFAMRDGESVTLRPEATAGIARALISGGLTQQLPAKFFCSGPMFRYERPQKGRQRQFHQVDIELLGVAEPLADIEVIALAADILDRLGVLALTELELNTLGDTASRTAYRDVLVEYFSDHLQELSEDSRERLHRNPLRILDSKDPGDRAVVAGAPEFAAHLTDDSHAFFAEVRAGLDLLGIRYRINPRLVRGLDYYCHTAFEFTTTALGAQGTVLGGGRYDGLLELLGGPAIPGIGWAGGIERLAMLAEPPQDAPRPVAVVPIGETAERAAIEITQRLRKAGVATELGYAGALGKRMKRADRIGAAVAVILGEDEMARRVATVRDLDSGEQAMVPLAELPEHLAARRS